MSAPQKQSRRKAEREAARHERAEERQRRRTADTVTDAPKVAAPPVDPRTPRPSR